MAADLLGRTSLGRTSVDGAGAALVAAVDDDPDPTVRVAALEAIRVLGGPPTAVAAAEASLFDPDARVRDAAIRALGAVADDTALAAIPGLPALARDPSPAVRAAMACLYGSRGPDPSSERLIAELLEDPDSEARVAGLAAVRRLRDTASIDATRALLGDPSPRVRVAVVEALAAFPDRARFGAGHRGRPRRRRRPGPTRGGGRARRASRRHRTA